MKPYLKKLGIGRSTLVLAAVGLLMLLLHFLGRKNISVMEIDLIIQRILRGQGFSPEMAKYFAAVSRHETGNYDSQVLKRSNNLFGMKHPVQRSTTSQGRDGSGYATYNSLADSVTDLALYLNARDYPFHFDSARALVTYMKRKGYFEAELSEYISGVERALPKVANI